MERVEPHVVIKPIGNKIQIDWSYISIYRPGSDGKLTCYIPGFDFYFSAPSEDIAKQKSDAMFRVFFDHMFIHNSKKALKMLSIELHKKGFKTDRDMFTMGKLVNNIPVKANFKSLYKKPVEFIDEVEHHHEGQMEVAI